MVGRSVALTSAVFYSAGASFGSSASERAALVLPGGFTGDGVVEEIAAFFRTASVGTSFLITAALRELIAAAEEEFSALVFGCGISAGDGCRSLAETEAAGCWPWISTIRR